jgi:hypothetical protein
MKTQPEHPYTQQQWQGLDSERQQVIQSVAEYLSGEKLPDNPTDETLSETFNLLRPCKGCVPEEEIDDNLAKSIRKKFAAVYWTAVELAVKELQRQGKNSGQDFTLYLVIDPDHEDYTYVTVVDPDKGRCFLHEGHKPWHFHFDSLTQIADAILRIRNVLVRKVTEALANDREMFIVMDGGLIQEMVDIPPGIRITVIDQDTEGVERDRLEKSPLDGKLCYLSHF